MRGVRGVVNLLKVRGGGINWVSSRPILHGVVDCQAQGALVRQVLQLLYHGMLLGRAAEGAAGGKSHFRLPAA